MNDPVATAERNFRARYGRNLKESGIHVVDLGGAGIPKKTDRPLSAVRTYANYYLLVFDNEGNTQKLIEELGRRGQKN